MKAFVQQIRSVCFGQPLLPPLPLSHTFGSTLLSQVAICGFMLLRFFLDGYSILTILLGHAAPIFVSPRLVHLYLLLPLFTHILIGGACLVPSPLPGMLLYMCSRCFPITQSLPCTLICCSCVITAVNMLQD